MRTGSRLLLVGLALACAALLPAAEIRVSGLGPLENLRARNNLQLLLGEQRRAALDASAIEDAALILFSQLTDEGHPAARITALITTTEGAQIEHGFDARLEHPLPRPLAAAALRFSVERGPRFLLRDIAFTGLQAVPPEAAREFFVGDTMLVTLASSRIYSPGRLNRALGNLQAELRQRGYAEATVTLGHLATDGATGRVDLSVVVQEGLPWRVAALHYEIADGSAPPDVLDPPDGAPWSSPWRQDVRTTLRRWYYQQGYPEVQIRLVPDAAPEAAGERRVTVTAHIAPGPQVRIGAINFTGNRHTHEPLLRRTVRIGPGELLNPIRVDFAQTRLARLGVFDRIEAVYTPGPDDTRDLDFVVSEGRRQEVNLLFGYGSYEQLRGGVELRHHNVFGRAQTASLRLVQSMKGSQAEHLHTVPELFGSAVDGSLRLFGLRREELAFLRQEYGASAALRWPLGRGRGHSLTTGYTFRQLRNTENELATRMSDAVRANAASVEIGWLRDQRDDPLRPRRGYQVFLQTEAASRWLGGDVDYQRLTLDTSYHTAWGRNRWVHAGFTHAVITTEGARPGAALPVNVRFYPGGDSSIRGYQRGEAAPRADNGQFIGAQSYMQLNLELEQALTSTLSAVVFVDALGTAVALGDYPFTEKLASVGLGLRYNTLIGPIRLEYGHNLNRRPLDPRGTVQFSVGFPF
ncbi:MAG TPA: BamA/TamA family outer membrane protein [Opitutaceae bacterium]|nr:BamA/TamA family outer membrane protein [Opitutaceae bacterium]